MSQRDRFMKELREWEKELADLQARKRQCRGFVPGSLKKKIYQANSKILELKIALGI